MKLNLRRVRKVRCWLQNPDFLKYSVTLKPLEYVTIDRGSPTRAEDNPFVTPLPLQEEKTPETPEERPKSNLGSERGSVRDLE